MNYKLIILLTLSFSLPISAEGPLVIEGDLFIPDLEDKPWPKWIPEIPKVAQNNRNRYEDYFMEYLTPKLPLKGYNLLYERWKESKRELKQSTDK